jgi:hypothetical protein
MDWLFGSIWGLFIVTISSAAVAYFLLWPHPTLPQWAQ